MASREELFSRFGLIKIVDSITEDAYYHTSLNRWEKDLDEAPHGTPWHTSFHASQFPGDDPKACDRKAMYGLLGIPKADPIEPKGVAIMDAGKDIERQVVQRWKDYGILLTAGPDEEIQTGFKFPELWLTGNTDAIILPHNWNRGHVVEVKTKDDDVITQMKQGLRTFDDEHRRQVLTYIAMAHIFSLELWEDLDPVTDGTLYYISRGRPRNTMEYYFSLDMEFFEQGAAKLREWQEYFMQGTLPPRPKEWRWTEPPCKWCEFKKICKQDIKEDIEDLNESNIIDFAKAIRSDYDVTEKRQAVLDRWSIGTSAS